MKNPLYLALLSHDEVHPSTPMYQDSSSVMSAGCLCAHRSPTLKVDHIPVIYNYKSIFVFFLQSIKLVSPAVPNCRVRETAMLALGKINLTVELEGLRLKPC